MVAKIKAELALYVRHPQVRKREVRNENDASRSFGHGSDLITMSQSDKRLQGRSNCAFCNGTTEVLL